ncbi:MBL fold metallo-hydrolase [Methanobacterium aggregans]|uniref:MBL fold metallo-hydrolase n=1 Tax=Methanobacterium aggregans TaxID=1615586 RepID=UPI001AE26C9B|nr:MBL fold metallo-hydrolase [Methanobacterium aggregans]MBP2046221.1 hydroxyacylglutathione hydrolase [Methanobacterium aggregans]
MIFEIVKSRGLSHKSYFIGSRGAAAVIDPRRDVDIYLDIAKRHDMNVEMVFETHRNEDYTVGSLELSKLVDAKIYHGAGLDFAYGNPAHEGDSFEFGSLQLEVLETPGHTPESISITVKDMDASEDVYMVFTGDALFAGEVGRCDIYGPEEVERMAGSLYDSINQKILPLGDGVIICPAHGSGSVCGAEIRDVDITTVGYEKKTNPLLQKTRRDFIEHKVAERFYIPPYFKRMELNNQRGAEILCRLPHLRALSTVELQGMDDGVQIIDVRDPESFAGGHIPGTLNIWSEGVPAFAGWFLNYHDPIVLVDYDGSRIESVERYLIRLGYDNIYGYLAGGFSSWFKSAGPVETIEPCSVHELRDKLEDPSIFLLDVRKEWEWEEEHIDGSHNIYIGILEEKLEDVPKDRSIILYCDTGYKAGIGASILKINGYINVTNVLGSIMAWKKAGYPTLGVEFHG